MTLKKEAVLHSRRSPENFVALGALESTFLFVFLVVVVCDTCRFRAQTAAAGEGEAGDKGSGGSAIRVK